MVPIASPDIKAVYLSEINRGTRLPQKPRTEMDKTKEKLLRYWRQKALERQEENAA
jgi:hypothetical protein